MGVWCSWPLDAHTRGRRTGGREMWGRGRSVTGLGDVRAFQCDFGVYWRGSQLLLSTSGGFRQSVISMYPTHYV